MKPLHQINDIRQAKALLNPLRVAILHKLCEPKTCLELAEALEISQQRANNNVKELLKAGLVRKVEARQKRNMMEGVYEAIGKSYWFSPKLAHVDARKQLRAQESLHNLMRMSERLQDDAAALLGRGAAEEVPSIGMTAEIVLRDETERQAFAKDLLIALHGVLEKYQGGGSGTAFTAMVVAYPHPLEGGN